MAKKKRARRTLTLQEKAIWITDKMKDAVRYHALFHDHIGIGFTMREIARMSGYAASSKLMNDLYAMCDNGYLVLWQRPIKTTGVADTRNTFWLPDSYADRMHQKTLLGCELGTNAKEISA